MKFCLSLIFMLIVINAYAHQPVLNEENPVSFDSPYLIEKPEVSKAIYSTLQGEPHIFKISSNKDFKFYAGITVPKIEGCNQFDKFSFQVLDTSQKVIKDFDGESIKWWPWYEKYGKKWYWVGPELGVKFKSNNAFSAGEGRPVLIDKYILGKEIEVDAVCDGETVFIPGIMEHIERAGVHSGDSMAVFPTISLSKDQIELIVDYTTRIAIHLGVKGLLNIQYVLNQNPSNSMSEVLVLEVNPRASRTVPFISKVTNVPLVNMAVKVMAGKKLKELGYNSGLGNHKDLFAVKAPVFSMSKLVGVDTTLGPEMKSTGEVMGIDTDFNSALYKALISSGMAMPKEGTVLISVADRDKDDVKEIVKESNKKGFNILATEGTANLIKELGFEVSSVPKVFTGVHPNVVDVINHGLVDVVINTVTGESKVVKDGFDIRRAATEKNIPCFTSLDGAQASLESVNKKDFKYNISPLKDYFEE